MNKEAETHMKETEQLQEDKHELLSEYLYYSNCINIVLNNSFYIFHKCCPLGRLILKLLYL